MNRTYTIWGWLAISADNESPKTIKKVVHASNMNAAVASFMASEDRPTGVLNWFIRKGHINDRVNKSHRISREKFGHAFDGVIEK